MAGLPAGEVTFAFTDIEGSTRLLEYLGDEGFAELLSAHHRLVREAVASCAGRVVSSEGFRSEHARRDHRRPGASET